MPNYIDLHIHSTFSDGTLSPAALVAHAKDLKLAAIAITDHDTVAGVEEAISHGQLLDIEVIPGIEISAKHRNSFLHILGYGLNHHNQELLANLGKYQEARQERNYKIIGKFNRLGITISIDQLKQGALDQIGRPHFARELVRQGVTKSEEAAFALFLRSGGKAFVESFRYSAEETIAMIRAAGGAAVLAHPATIDSSLATIPALLSELKPLGLAGVEVFYAKNPPKVNNKLEKLARKFDLLLTGGSDFHGHYRNQPNAPANGLAHHVPAHLLQPLKEAMRSV
jgi:predicted metal-dependent phosphoesterase TrpH